MRKRRLLCVVTMCLLSVPVLAEVQVNVRTSGSQSYPAVAMDGTGRSVIVWSSYFTTPGRSNDVLARRLDALGGFAGDEFQINTISEGNQTAASVAMSRRGDFVVAWQGPGPGGDDVYVRRFDGEGRPAGDDVRIDVRVSGRQLCPSVAMDGTGAFVVAWESRQMEADAERTCVRVQVFDPNGLPLSEAVMADAGLYDCRYPDVAVDGSGGFVVTWAQERSRNTILARRFDASGTAVTEPFDVSAVTFTSLTRPSIAMNRLGYFVIAWDGDPNRASEDDVHARFYDPNAVGKSDPFVVNTLADGAQQWPCVTMNDANEFVVVWEHETGDPNRETEIFARRFDERGIPLGDAFMLNTFTPGRQRRPAVAMAGDGSFVAVWESDGQDGSSSGIFACIGAPTVSADFDADGRVNFGDLSLLSRSWRQRDAGSADLTRDRFIDARDLATLCRQWLSQAPADRPESAD